MSSSVILFGNNLKAQVNFRLDFMRYLKQQGWQVSVACPYRQNHDDIAYKLLLQEGIEFIPLNVDSKGANPLKDAMLIFHIFRILSKKSPTLAIHYTIKPVIYGSIASFLACIPSFSVITGAGYTFLNDDLKSKVARLLYKVGLSCTKKVLFINQDDRVEFINRGLCTSQKAFVIPGEGFNPSQFAPSSTRKKNEHFRFLFVGRVLYDKGIREYFEAAKILHKQGINATFDIIGELSSENPSSVDEQTFNSWISQGYIKYSGYSENVISEIENSDCIVLPSYREGISRTLLEAAALEKPIVTTDVTGCRDIVVHNKSGLLARARDAQSLADSCLQMYNMTQSERDQMGKFGRRWVTENFANSIVFEKYQEVIQEFTS